MLIKDIYILKASNPIELKALENATINLELEKIPPCYNTLLTGKVYSKDIPIKNATVMVLDEECMPLFNAVTNEEGVYSFYNILKPGKYQLIAAAIGYKTSMIETIYIRDNIATEQSFELYKSSIFENGIVYGKILESESRKPIENAMVTLSSLEEDRIVYQTISSKDGEYLIYDILPNDYILKVRKQGYMASKPLKLLVEEKDQIMLYIDLIKECNSCRNTISGTITHHDKQISDAAVFLYCVDDQNNEKLVQIQETNEKGYYLFTNVASGNYVVKGKQQNFIIYDKKFTIE